MVSPHIPAAFNLLFQSFSFAESLKRDRWDFAVEMESLRDLGITSNDIRWLLCKGWVEHAMETTSPSSQTRTFAPIPLLMLNNQCSFVLTESGIEVSRELKGPPRVPNPTVINSSSSTDGLPLAILPCWDEDRRLLRIGNQVVKHFKIPAPNQEKVLIAFQEECWKVRIDDPLPSRLAIDPKRRLHDTINSLNRNQRIPLLHFSGDGSGEAICWEYLPISDAR